MRKRFVLATEEISKADEEAIVEYCKQNQFGWWHWLNNFWLLYTDDESVSVAVLRDRINMLFPEKRTLIVLEIGPSEAENWSGFGTREMFEWLQDGWIEK